MRGSSRPHAERANAVGIAVVSGVKAASKATGIPMRSVRQYLHDPQFAELRLSARHEVGEIMWATIQVGLDHLHAGLVDPDESLKAKQETVAMLIDKRALLMGDATARIENVSVTDGLNDHEREALSDAILGELARRADAGTESIAVGAAGATGATTAEG